MDKKFYLWNSMTVSNPIVLGTESTANWGPRLVINKGKDVKLTGLITVSSSKILLDANSKLAISGGITGTKVILAGS